MSDVAELIKAKQFVKFLMKKTRRLENWSPLMLLTMLLLWMLMMTMEELQAPRTSRENMLQLRQFSPLLSIEELQSDEMQMKSKKANKMKTNEMGKKAVETAATANVM